MMEEEKSIQYILNENKEIVEIPKDEAKPVEYPVKYKLKKAFEVFVRVKGTENYWISNYGRCINNLNRKDKADMLMVAAQYKNRIPDYIYQKLLEVEIKPGL